MVLEGQGRYFFSYSNVLVIEGWTCLGPLLQSSLQAQPDPPLIRSSSCALHLGIRTAHPSFTPATSRGLAQIPLNPLCSLP